MKSLVSSIYCNNPYDVSSILFRYNLKISKWSNFYVQDCLILVPLSNVFSTAINIESLT